MGKYYSTKTYGHNIGLSAVFRQPNADHSHCHLLHGYSLQFKFTFGCKELDNKNWAVDFGGLKPLKAWLEDNFDHKLCLDKDDPHIGKFKELDSFFEQSKFGMVKRGVIASGDQFVSDENTLKKISTSG